MTISPNMLEDLEGNKTPIENDSSSSSEEIDEDRAMADLLKTDNGREFMTFVNK